MPVYPYYYYPTYPVTPIEGDGYNNMMEVDEEYFYRQPLRWNVALPNLNGKTNDNPKN